MGIGNPAKLTARVALTSALYLSAAAALFAADPQCREDQVYLRGDWGQARFTVELADDEEERARGLMHRESLPRSSGMLFVYPEPRLAGFWMKNTLIPLDMLFFDENGMLTKLHSNAQPHDERPIIGGDQVFAVLEVNGGLSEQMGITEGSQIRHPAFASDKAAWPCGVDEAGS
jgi:uncharacterized membrane protein (UPF0127 family)